jgi:GrpB-like predicted nucleotidyltransferase (UPF0157 family)
VNTAIEVTDATVHYGHVLALDHVGSTSVPGLPAKPCVDLLLVVADSADEPAYLPDLEEAGYSLVIREPDWYEHRVLKGPSINLNLHVFGQGCEEADRMRLFRDYLTADAGARKRYTAVKRELGSLDPACSLRSRLGLEDASHHERVARFLGTRNANDGPLPRE